VVQFAYDWQFHADIFLFLLHFLLGMIVGLPILAPAYTLQAGLYLLLARWKSPLLLQLAGGAALQAGIVLAWDRVIGVQPSLGGNFPMLPVMAGAAALVGGLVAGLAWWMQRTAKKRN